MKKALFTLAQLFLFSLLISQEITIDKHVNMLALGDSYTIGESVEIRERWPHQLIDELRKLGVSADYPDYIAVTGWTTSSLIKGINLTLDENKDYNLVSILIGVNNQYQGIDIASYEPDLRNIIDQALEIVNKESSRVLILSIPDYAYTPYGGQNEVISEELDEYNDIKRRVAAEYGITYIDITTISRNGISNPSLVAQDGLHPSGKQYRLWVQSIMPRLKLDLSLSAIEKQPFSSEKVWVYPNPTGTSLNIDSSIDIDYIQIYNALGSFVSDSRVIGVPFMIDLSYLAPGTYTLLARSSNKLDPSLRRTFVIQAN